MRVMYAIAISLIAAVVAVFIYSNVHNADVKLSFLTWSWQGPQWAVILGIYALGAVTGAGLFTFIRRGLHKITEEPQPPGGGAPGGKPGDKKKPKK
ncbi:MAG: hypothetical protein ACREJ2_13340 [Planctomycetota bacterium]